MTAAEKTPKIVVSYRRSDSAMAGRIFDRLVQRFGENSLFIDIDNIPFGSDFRKHIADALTSSDLLIAMVGEKWLGRREGGNARITDDSDPVRVELETALARKIHILPVLLDNTKMPDPQDLPDSIKNFAYLNAVDVESGRDFKVHFERLIGAIEKIVGIKSPSPVPVASKRRDPKFMLIGAFLIVALLGAGAWFLRDRLASQGETASPEFCETFNKVLGEAPTRFESILGAKIYEMWTARIQLPGWEYCRIGDFRYFGTQTKRFYTCALPPFASLEAADERQNIERKNVMGCLGQGWTESRQTYPDYKNFTYIAAPADPIVTLRTNHDETQKNWTLTLNIEEPEPNQ